MPDRNSAVLAALTRAIEAQESGGASDALGQLMTGGAHKGDRAMGMFQFMPQTLHSLFADPAVRMRAKLSDARSFIPGVTDEQGLEDAFLDSPEFQRFGMGELLRSNSGVLKSNDPKALALAHYAGTNPARVYLDTGYISDDPLKHAKGPTEREYVDQVMGRMQPPVAPQVDPLQQIVQAAARGMLR